jgi:TonB family protein
VLSTDSAQIKVQKIDALIARDKDKKDAIYIGVILSLLVHIFVLGTSYMVISSPEKERIEKPDVLEEVEISLLEMDIPEPEMNEESMMSEEVRNLVASANSERVKERVDYRGKTQEQIAQEVADELAAFEAAEKAALAQNHKSIPRNEIPDKNKSTSTQKEKNEPIVGGSDKSSTGNVAVEYDLKGRKPTNGRPKPTYRCQLGGKVVVKIDVDQTGAVTNTSIDDSKSSSSACLREDALTYAKKWRFDYGPDRRQSGTITFTFAAQ